MKMSLVQKLWLPLILCLLCLTGLSLRDAYQTRNIRLEERKADLVATVPLQRVAEPDEIANAIVFLASSRSSFTTGQVLFVDGGKSAA